MPSAFFAEQRESQQVGSQSGKLGFQSRSAPKSVDDQNGHLSDFKVYSFKKNVYGVEMAVIIP